MLRKRFLFSVAVYDHDHQKGCLVTTTRRAFGALAAGGALAALAPAGQAGALPGHHHRGRFIARDDFRHGLGQWAVELQDGGSATATRGVLEVDVPSGATIWFKRRVQGPYVIEYTPTLVSAAASTTASPTSTTSGTPLTFAPPDDLFAPFGAAPSRSTTTSTTRH